MKKFYLVICADCAKEKRELKSHFHLYYKEQAPKRPYLHCRCYVCGAEEDFFFSLVEEGKESELARKQLKVIET